MRLLPPHCDFANGVLTFGQLKDLPKYTSDGDSYRELEGKQMITLSELN